MSEKIIKESLTNKKFPCPNTPSHISGGLEGRRILSLQKNKQSTKKKTPFKSTTRDMILLEQLNSYGVLSTQQIREIIFKSINIKTVLRRLRLLRAEGFLLSSEGLPNGGLAWFLTKKAASLFHSSAHTKPINKNSLQHDVTVSSIRMKLESKKIALYWKPEHLLKKQALKTLYDWEKSLSQVDDPPIVPDGLFITKHEGEMKSIALELETSVKSIKRYRKLFSLYRDKEKIWMVWYVVLNKSFGESLLKLWHKYNENFSLCGFSYSTLKEVLSEDFQLPKPSVDKKRELYEEEWDEEETEHHHRWVLERY